MYRLAAVIAGAGVLGDRVAGTSHGVVVVLRAGLEMAPVSDELFEELTGGSFAGRMSPAFDRVLAGWSVPGPLAVVEADFFGGDGHQTATLWRAGAPVWGPAFDDTFDGTREQWPINAALARLGVRPSGRTYSWDPDRPVDLFDEVGLGLEREVPDWVAYGRAGRTPGRFEAPARDRELAEITPDLDGRAIMSLLGLPPGPLVGAATRRLRELSLDRGPLSRADAEAELLAWAREQGIRPSASR